MFAFGDKMFFSIVGDNVTNKKYKQKTDQQKEKDDSINLNG